MGQPKQEGKPKELDHSKNIESDNSEETQTKLGPKKESVHPKEAQTNSSLVKDEQLRSGLKLRSDKSRDEDVKEGAKRKEIEKPKEGEKPEEGTKMQEDEQTQGGEKPNETTELTAGEKPNEASQPPGENSTDGFEDGPGIQRDGNETDAETQYPWMTAILYYKNPEAFNDRFLVPSVALMKGGNLEIYSTCSGILIQLDRVLTSCHCLMERENDGFFGPGMKVKNPAWLRVKAGTTTISPNPGVDEGQLIPAKWLNVHPKCVEGGRIVKTWDLGILELTNNFTEKSGVVEIYPTSNFYGGLDDELNAQIEKGLSCKTLSWCVVNEETNNEYNLCQAENLMISSKDCEDVLESNISEAMGTMMTFDKHSHVCTLPISGNCGGDTGGPLFCGTKKKEGKPILYGIVSFKMNCSDSEFPTVYTKMTEKICWWLTAVAKYGSEMSRMINKGFNSNGSLIIDPEERSKSRSAQDVGKGNSLEPSWLILMALSLGSLAFS